MIRMRLIPTSLVVACLAGTATAQPLPAPGRPAESPEVLTLDEAVSQALHNAPSIAASRAAVTASQEAEGVAFAPWLPQISLNGTYDRRTGNYAAPPGSVPSGSSTGSGTSWSSYNYFAFGLSVTQNIYDFGRTGWANDRAAIGTEIARHQMATVRLETWFRVVTAYYAALAAQQMVDLTEKMLVRARYYVERVKGLVEAGARPRIDIVRTEADAFQAEASHIAARENRHMTLLALMAAMGVKEPYSPKLKAPAATNLGEPPPLAEGLAEAMANRPEHRIARDAVRSQEAEIARIKSDYWPIIGAAASATEAGSQISNLVWNWQIGVGLTVPIFSGLSTRHSVRAAEAVLAGLRSNQDGLNLQIRAEVEQARARISDAAAHLVPITELVVASRQAMELADERYKAGMGNQVELLDAQSNLAGSEAELVRSEYILALAWASYWRAVGRIPGQAAE